MRIPARIREVVSEVATHSLTYTHSTYIHKNLKKIKKKKHTYTPPQTKQNQRQKTTSTTKQNKTKIKTKQNFMAGKPIRPGSSLPITKTRTKKNKEIF